MVKILLDQHVSKYHHDHVIITKTLNLLFSFSISNGPKRQAFVKFQIFERLNRTFFSHIILTVLIAATETCSHTFSVVSLTDFKP